MRYSNETLFSEKHISFMTERGYEAKSHKLSQGKWLVLKSCEFIRSSWLMEDKTWSFYGTNLRGTNTIWIYVYI